MILHGKRSLLLIATITLLGAVNASSQGNESQREAGYSAGSTRRDRTSDLARKNLERVAASAAQLQTVLIKEAGILVELKRWVAKEATDNGQIVEDNDLTDQAIFDRLDRDLGFRSVATQLVQRYGYLLPNLNPDSDAAKEQDLILKERARRFVQLEAQEDAAPPAAQQTQNNDNNKNNTGARTERTSCDSRNQDCDMRDLRRRQSARQPSDEMTTPSFPGSDMLQQMPSSDQLRSLRMASGRDESGLGSSGADGGLSLASDSSRRASSRSRGQRVRDGWHGRRRDVRWHGRDDGRQHRRHGRYRPTAAPAQYG